MNSYGSMSRVSESIYKFLRYMNWIVPATESDDTTHELNHSDLPSGS